MALDFWAKAFELLSNLGQTQAMIIYRSALALHYLGKPHAAIEMAGRAVLFHNAGHNTDGFFFGVCDEIFPKAKPKSQVQDLLDAEPCMTVSELVAQWVLQSLPLLCEAGQKERFDTVVRYLEEVSH